MSDKDTCATCWYFRADEPDAVGKVRTGECRRKPPKFPKRGGGRWPTTGVRDWCGEYRSRISMEMQPLHKPKEGEA